MRALHQRESQSNETRKSGSFRWDSSSDFSWLLFHEFSWWYSYHWCEVQKKHAPVLVVHDRWSKTIYAHVLPYKGISQGPIGSKCLLNDLKKLGYPKMVMRYDPEPALNSVVEAAKNGFDKELVLEKVPRGVSESKGEIEKAVQTIESHSRTLRNALETSYGRKIPDDHPVLTWMVEHASTTYNLFHRSLEVKDGKTPYSRHRGREWRVSLPPFGETIEFLRRGHKFEARWHQGIFLGVKDNTTEKIVGNASGVFTVQSIRRRSAGDRCDVETLMSVTGVPWDPQATKMDEVPLPRIVEGDQQPLAPPVQEEKSKKVLRRLYITKRDLDKHGFTAGCPACDATRIGKRSTGVHHTPACRERMERLLHAEEGNLRVAQHTAKTDAEITGQKQEVSEEGTKILYGYSSERPQGVPQDFKVFARLDKQARYMKGTLPEGPNWDKVLWRVTREFKTGKKGQKRPNEPGGETSKPKDRRADSAQATKGTKRPPEDERPGDIDQCLMNLITEDRVKYLQSTEGENEPVCEETIPLPPELEDEAATWFYYDDISGKVLDAKGVEKARKHEIEIIESFPVWEKIPRHKMPKGTRTIGTRWVDVNKQDEENPLYRSRLVAQEVKKGSGFDEFFAAMPSLSALKMLVTIAVTFQLPHAGTAVKEAYAKRRLLGFLDVKRAHFYSDATRELYVELPAEAKKPGEDVVGKLLKSLYGTRDAPLNWELQIRKVIFSLRFQTRQEKSLHLFPRRSWFANSSPWRWLYNSRNFWKHQMAPWWTVKEVEMHWARYFRTARNTEHNPGHQSPEQNHHLEGRWNLVGTRRPSCRACYCFVGRWPPWRQSHHATRKRSGGESQGHCRISEWWRSNPVQISCHACRLFGTRSSWPTSSN